MTQIEVISSPQIEVTPLHQVEINQIYNLKHIKDFETDLSEIKNINIFLEKKNEIVKEMNVLFRKDDDDDDDDELLKFILFFEIFDQMEYSLIKYYVKKCNCNFAHFEYRNNTYKYKVFIIYIECIRYFISTYMKRKEIDIPQPYINKDIIGELNNFGTTFDDDIIFNLTLSEGCNLEYIITKLFLTNKDNSNIPIAFYIKISQLQRKMVFDHIQEVCKDINKEAKDLIYNIRKLKNIAYRHILNILKNQTERELKIAFLKDNSTITKNESEIHSDNLSEAKPSNN